jgi:integrase/recombinase XerD
MKFEQALEGYWLEKDRDLSPHTVRDYRYTFERFRLFIGDREVAEITSDDIRRFLNVHLVKKFNLSDKSRCNAWVALASFWTWAEQELKVEHVIRNRVKQPSYGKPLIVPYTELEVRAMLAAVEYSKGWVGRAGGAARSRRPTGLRDRAILLTLFDTGVRASELTEFEIRDYLREQGQLTVRHGKGDKKRVVFLGQSGRKALWQYLTTRDASRPSDPLFATKNGTKLGRSELLHMIQRTAKRASVAHANVHKFRHSFAINFLRNGGNVLELQEMLGHEKLETIRIYVKLAEVDLAAAQRRASPADKWRL